MDSQLPHSPDAEACVIGSVLINPEAYNYISLNTEDFYIHRFRFIWGAIQAVVSSGLGVDVVTVIAELERRNQLEEVGGSAKIYDLMNHTPDAFNVESYAEIVKRDATNRMFIEVAQSMLTQSFNGGVDVAGVIEKLTSYSRGERDGRMIGGALDDLEIFMHDRINNPKDVWGIPTGFVDLDYRSGGLQKQRVLMLSGESGTGKTTLALQIAIHAAKNGHGVIIFETEMPEQSTLIRMVELECGLPYRAVMSGRVTEEQMHTWIHTKGKMERLPIYINDDPAINTADIRRIINRVRVEHFKPELIILDYLGNLTDEPEYGKADFDQTKAKRFREVVRYSEVSGIAIQDMTKGDGTKLTSMSGGAKVRYSADEVYFIVQDETNPKIHYLIPTKERYGDQVKKFVTLLRPGLGFKNAQTMDLNNLEYEAYHV